MVLIVPLVGPSAFGFVFVWFSYVVARFSYGFTRPPHWSFGFVGRFRMVFLWFCKVSLWYSLVHQLSGSVSYCFPMVL